MLCFYYGSSLAFWQVLGGQAYYFTTFCQTESSLSLSSNEFLRRKSKKRQNAAFLISYAKTRLNKTIPGWQLRAQFGSAFARVLTPQSFGKAAAWLFVP